MQQMVDSLDVDLSHRTTSKTQLPPNALPNRSLNITKILYCLNKISCTSGADLDHGLILTVYSQTDVTFGSLTSYPLLYLVGCVTVLCFALCDMNEAKLNV